MALFLTGGPSGAGKDTLLLGAQKALSEAGDTSVLFKRRRITRTEVTDLEIPMSAEEFAKMKESGGFSLSWEAHGTCYAIPVDLKDDLKAGKSVVCNVSRTVIDEAFKQFGDIAEVYFLNFTASEQVLYERLVARAREDEAEILKRVKRAKELEPKGAHVINIVNEAGVSDGVQRVVAALKSEMKFTLWLVPPASQVSKLNTEASRLAIENAMKPFPLHITLSPSFVTSQAVAVQLAKQVADSLSLIDIKLKGVEHSPEFFQAIAIAVEPSEALTKANAVAKKIVSGEKAFKPHLSLLYGDLPEAKRVDIVGDLVKKLSSENLDFVASELVAVMTVGTTYNCWTEVCRFPFSDRNNDLKRKIGKL